MPLLIIVAFSISLYWGIYQRINVNLFWGNGVIARMLGLPSCDLANFIYWTNRFTQVGQGNNPLKALPAMFKFIAYINGQIRKRRENPDEGLISSLIRAQESDDRLTDNEILAMIFLLLTAGHETTVNLLGTSFLVLLQHPEQANSLYEDISRVPRRSRNSSGLSVRRKRLQNGMLARISSLKESISRRVT